MDTERLESQKTKIDGFNKNQQFVMFKFVFYSGIVILPVINKRFLLVQTKASKKKILKDGSHFKHVESVQDS